MTGSEIQQSVNALIAAKLRGHAKGLLRMAEDIEEGRYEPDSKHLKRLDNLTDIVAFRRNSATPTEGTEDEK